MNKPAIELLRVQLSNVYERKVEELSKLPDDSSMYYAILEEEISDCKAVIDSLNLIASTRSTTTSGSLYDLLVQGGF